MTVLIIIRKWGFNAHHNCKRIRSGRSRAGSELDGLHIDNALMPLGIEKMRTDLSYTLFLSDPEAYKGGELQVEHAGQSMSLKPGAGDLVLYPSTSLHSVSEVVSGTRLACVGWIESRVQRPDDRELIFDMANLKTALSKQYQLQSPEMLMSAKIFSNLIRRFS